MLNNHNNKKKVGEIKHKFIVKRIRIKDFYPMCLLKNKKRKVLFNHKLLDRNPSLKINY